MNFFLIPIIVLAVTPLYQAKNPNKNDESEIMKQHRLFSNANSWRLPSELLTDEQSPDADEQLAEALGPNVLYLEDLLQHQRKPFSFQQPYAESDSNYDLGHYDSEKELESSLPYGIQNVLEGGSARMPRSKNRLARITFQSLCPSKRETVFLNIESEYEYRPDQYEEVTCSRHIAAPHHEFRPPSNKILLPVCTEAGFACIQLNRTLFLTRRAHGTDCWESETRLVPAGCECMWPKHHLGDISAHH